MKTWFKFIQILENIFYGKLLLNESVFLSLFIIVCSRYNSYLSISLCLLKYFQILRWCYEVRNESSNNSLKTLFKFAFECTDFEHPISFFLYSLTEFPKRSPSTCSKYFCQTFITHFQKVDAKRKFIN